MDNNQTRVSIQLTQKYKFRIKRFILFIGQLVVSLTERISAYETNYQRFDFLNKFEYLEFSELQSAANRLVNIYPNGLELLLYRQWIHTVQCTFWNSRKNVVTLL